MTIEAEAPAEEDTEQELCDACSQTEDNCECSSCEDCGSRFVPSRDAVRARYCADCEENYFLCERCGEVTNVCCLQWINDSLSVCEGCAERYYIYCDECDEWHEEACENGIHDYGYKPEPIFYAVIADEIDTAWGFEPGPRMHHWAPAEVRARYADQRPVYMGFELECEAVRANLRAGIEAMSGWAEDDVAYLKHDGSLDNGFEIVSHPHTLDAFKLLDFGCLDRLRELGFRSWNTQTCGIHVHVSRQAFVGKAHLYRFTKLLLDNAPSAKRLAGRDSEDWATFDGVAHHALRTIAKKGGYPARYCAVNLQNEHTVEVRIFRGSLNVSRLLTNLELVDALVEYTRNMTLTDIRHNALLWGHFQGYVRQNAERYPNLFTHRNITARDNDAVRGA